MGSAAIQIDAASSAGDIARIISDVATVRSCFEFGRLNRWGRKCSQEGGGNEDDDGSHFALSSKTDGLQ